MLSRLLTILITVLFISLSWPASAQTYQGGYLEGTVVDSETKTPINKVRILFLEHQTVAGTNRKGEFSFSNLNPGGYTLVILHDNYQEYKTRVDVEEGNNSLRIELKAKEEDSE